MAKIILALFILLIWSAPAQAEPISLAIASMTTLQLALTSFAIAAVVASTAIGVTSSITQANQQKAVANYQRQVNEQNARASREAAQAKVVNQRRQLRFTQGTQLARLGGMGALAEGSPLDIMGQTAGQAEYDNMVTEYEGEVQAIQFQQQAALNKYQADIADYNLGLNVTGQVVKGAASIGSSILGASGGLASAGATFGKTAAGSTVGTNAAGNVFAPLSSGLA